MGVQTLQLTDAGLAAVQGASGSDPVTISELGLTATAFDFAPTLTALPGEFKRVEVLSGVAAAPNVTHLTAYDTSAEVWTATGIALYIDDGTLFGVVNGAEPLMSKVAVAFVLLVFDIAFNADLAANIEYGNAVFTWPPATETIQGVAELATQAEVDAGADDQRIVTPLKLATLLAALLAPVTAAVAAITDSLAALLADVWRPSNDGAGSGLDADMVDGRHGAWYAPPGQVAAFAMAIAPSGWLPCAGDAVSRETYAALFAAIGTTFGAGDGATTFNLPDLRGEFVRGWDNGRGVDAGRAMASAQADELKSHAHGLKISTELYASHDGSEENDRTVRTSDAPQDNYITATGGTETRPRNIALLYCIKI